MREVVQRVVQGKFRFYFQKVRGDRVYLSKARGGGQRGRSRYCNKYFTSLGY